MKEIKWETGRQGQKRQGKEESREDRQNGKQEDRDERDRGGIEEGC